MISRENYEIWFIDFLDGKLSSAQKGELYAFLSQNPDLKCELDDMSVDVPMLSESYNMPKQYLKKHIRPVANISESTYEEVLIASIEGDLSSNEKLELDDFLVINPFLVAELKYYEKLTVSHNGEVFPAKNQLKHSPVIVHLFRYAVAASVIVVLGVGLTRYGSEVSAPEAQTALTYTMDFPTVKSLLVADKPSNSVMAKEAKQEIIKETTLPQIKQPIQTTDIALQALDPLPSSGFNIHISESNFTAFPISENIDGNDALSFGQLVGKVMEGSFGENGFSDGLKKEEKLTAGDIVDFAAIPFKKNKQPVLSTMGGNTSGQRRVKLNLGIFEADFALH